ncbi:MAG TPA: four helix bundle protein, partial [Dehalococcoidia bacterium]|nr:four helix bundle protein [Dehalococcoidia bacterium]
MQSTEYTVQPLSAAKAGKPAFCNLVLWEKAQTLASQLVLLVDGLPRTRSANALGDQLLRAGTSIAANVAEGYGRYSDPAFRNHLS